MKVCNPWDEFIYSVAACLTVYCQILLHLPYSRRLEEEADEVGLKLMAKVRIVTSCISFCNGN